MKSPAAAALLALAIATPARADDQRIELGPFVGVHRFNDDSELGTFDEADAVMSPLLGRPLTSFIFVDGDDPAAVQTLNQQLMQTEITQPAVLATDLALTRLLEAYGIRPDLVMGHSLGEYAALVAAGALSFAAALEAVSARGREMASLALADNGAMAAVFGPLGEIERIVAETDGYVVVANINSTSQAVVGGATEAVERAVAAFRDDPGPVVLLSSEVGSEGLDFQFCSRMFNYDLPWNPQRIEQRIGRVDRIGEQREVFIFNLVTRGTLEDQVLRILDEKINMFELVVGEVGAILGEIDEEQDFSDLIMSAWLEATEASRVQALDELGRRLSEARSDYDSAKEFDDELFGENFAIA